MKRLALSLFLLFTTLAYAGETVLYTFKGGTDGYRPNGPLVSDAAGNLYGTTFYGGNEKCSIGCGTVFELSPDGHGGWTETVLYRFTGGADGQNPNGGLILDSQGNLYGTTLGSGASCAPKCGSAFELSLGAKGWVITVLHAFRGGKDGGNVLGGLTADSAGNLYGTTRTFGPKGAGTTFQLSRLGDGWTLKTLHAFALDPNGASPEGSLVVDPAGTTIYGAAGFGGPSGYGVAFGLTLNAKKQWTEQVLFPFPGGNRGANPTFGLSSDSSGNLYGIATKTTIGLELVYQLSKSQGKWTEKTIFSFRYPATGQPDGAEGNVFVDQGGNLLGLGDGGSARDGTIYELSQSQGKWTETLLYSFVGLSGGVLPLGPPIMDQSGNLYGVTTEGGSGCSGNGGCGVVFEFTQ
jgi:uncharacterized repeat protein (TIGR03803 family)